MSLLDLIPAPYRIAAEIFVIVAVAGAVGSAAGWFVHHERDLGRAEIQQKWDADVSRQRADALAEAESNAKEEKRRLERQGEAQNENATELARYQRAAADAVAARDGLRLDVDNLTAVARGAARDSATGGERAAGAAAAGVLADMSRGADASAEVYAREADASRRAGVLCERSYDALNQGAQQK